MQYSAGSGSSPTAGNTLTAARPTPEGALTLEREGWAVTLDASRTYTHAIDRSVALQVALMRMEDGEPVDFVAWLIPASHRERKRPRQNPRATWAQGARQLLR